MALFGFGNSQSAGSGGPDAEGLIKDSTDQSFKADVIDASMQQPVLVDFWAPWCGPCRTLGPTIEKVVKAAKGKVKLVKINIDENPAYAGQLRVQSIPAVFAFDQGRPVDGFMGALPESQIKAFVERLGGGAPSGVEALLEAAAESLRIGDLGGAAQSFAEAAGLDPENGKALAGLAKCYALGGDMDRAGELLAAIPPDKAKDPEVATTIASIRAQITLAAEAKGAGDPEILARQAKAAPTDLETRFGLAKALIASGDLEGAVDNLLHIIATERNWNEDAARTQLLKIFDATGPMSEIARNGRRRLSAILFS
jgi:putative thioredoxin